ncbi:NAD(P)-binding protein [Penicillium maclennaniae]|uniref:NAD(P)-binding protein n=1 Tax=Penicillium maclennaniae TaxID=1343394 RepID=UPI002540645D|nr:NAD(P)-binding protein [Penicillium maclennaniae]KAJ5683837.1 NAD(P)-binding protein [Penicillium maclennaniae]
MESETIFLLGGNRIGGPGLAFIEEALSFPKPPHLVLYVRTSSNSSPVITKNINVSLVKGELTDLDALTSAMKDHFVTTVVSFLGAYVSFSAMLIRRIDTPIAGLVPTLIRAIEVNRVKRLLALSTSSYWIEDRDVATWTMSMYKALPKLFAQRVSESSADLDWTIFRIPHLTDGSADLPVWADYIGPSHKGGLKLSRRSQACWAMREIQAREWVRRSPFLANS